MRSHGQLYGPFLPILNITTQMFMGFEDQVPVELVFVGVFVGVAFSELVLHFELVFDGLPFHFLFCSYHLSCYFSFDCPRIPCGQQKRGTHSTRERRH